MMGLLETIKKAGAGAVQAGNPVHVLFGTVVGETPLEVNVHQRLTLSGDFLIVPEGLTRYTVTFGDQEVVIREGLTSGDRVLLLRIQGGQQFVIIDKVVV